MDEEPEQQGQPAPEPEPASELRDALLASLRGVVPKPDLYLIRAAQASTLRHLKTARRLLRDWNAAGRQQLEQHAAASEAGAAQLLAIRADLDATYACIRALKQQLAEHRPQLHAELLAELAAAGE